MNAPKQQSALPRTGYRVLVVEDDSELRLIVAALLREEGYLVEDATDVRPALHRLRASRDPLVVLLELNMPGMDGQALLQAIADDALPACHAFILITAHYQRTLPLRLARLLTQLNVAVVAKPFDVVILLDSIAAATARLLTN